MKINGPYPGEYYPGEYYFEGDDLYINVSDDLVMSDLLDIRRKLAGLVQNEMAGTVTSWHYELKPSSGAAAHLMLKAAGFKPAGSFGTEGAPCPGEFYVYNSDIIRVIFNITYDIVAINDMKVSLAELAVSCHAITREMWDFEFHRLLKAETAKQWLTNAGYECRTLPVEVEVEQEMEEELEEKMRKAPLPPPGLFHHDEDDDASRLVTVNEDGVEEVSEFPPWYYLQEPSSGYGPRIWVPQMVLGEDVLGDILNRLSSWGGYDKREGKILAWEFSNMKAAGEAMNKLEDRSYSRKFDWDEFYNYFN